VVGLPLNMNGTEGPRAEASRLFAAELEKRLGLSVELWDERLTTVSAQRVLIEANVRREDRRKVVDTVAATLILQGWMEAKSVKKAWDDEEER
jgi:putative holliday junction resolvase